MAQLNPALRFGRRHRLLVANKRRARRDAWIVAVFMMALVAVGATWYFLG